MKKRYLTIAFVLLSIASFAQHGYRDANRIGVFVGMNQLTLNTDNFETKPENGWNAGLSIRGNFYNDFDMVYAMQFSENNFSVKTTNGFITNEEVNYKLSSAQISLMLSYKIIENHLSVEIGPLVQLNGKLKVDSDKENNTINGTDLFAKDIVDISKFNFYPVIGITTGVRHVRLNVSYQYGLMNMMDNLNKQDLGVDFKVNPGIVNANLIFYL